MTPRKRRRAVPQGGVLDWRDSSHWSHTERPCRYCGLQTHLRDSRHSPAHKVCAELALVRQAAEAAEAYQNGTL